MAIVFKLSLGTKNSKMKHQEKLLVILERKLHVSVNITESKISSQLQKMEWHMSIICCCHGSNFFDLSIVFAKINSQRAKMYFKR